MKAFIKMSMFVMVFAFLMAPQADAAWPGKKPITVVVMFGAGGGTDTTTRGYVKPMEKFIGTTVNVVNRPGAIGALGTQFVYSKPADGYWWLGASQFCKPHRVMGFYKWAPWKTWQFYKSAGGLFGFAVRTDSPFQTMDEFLEAARKEPGKYRFTTSGIGSIEYEGNSIFAKEAKIKVRYIPYKSDAEEAMGLLQGEADIMGGGLHGNIEFIRAGKMRNLAVFSTSHVKTKGGLVFKPITKWVPSLAPYSPFGTEYTLAVKRDTPVEILEKIKEAFVASVNSPEFETLMERRFFYKALTFGREADRLAAFRESVTSWLFWDEKIEGAKANPADLGIPRPENFDAWWPPKDYKPVLK
jgi:tripartite-type tricarboxylate transporter receptor subunit TctC